jgi:hypothetical protein
VRCQWISFFTHISIGFSVYKASSLLNTNKHIELFRLNSISINNYSNIDSILTF